MILIITSQLILTGCGNQSQTQFSLETPEIPENWLYLLGKPNWRIEWLELDGHLMTIDVEPGKSIVVNPPTTWVNPVIAWPYWPNYKIIPGFFKPAGALFPFDVHENTIFLSWEAGVDAFFYRELDIASVKSASKLPKNFNWPNFRELLNQETTNQSICNDPWLVNWQKVAEKTVNSNFDKRQLVPEQKELVKIPVSKGPWYGASPFAEALYSENDESMVFPVMDEVELWISKEGILRCNRKNYVLENW